jgi:hypothetical protein
MTVGEVRIEPHEKGVGWYRMTITSLENFVGQTKVEFLIREEFLRKIRNEADRAISEKTNPRNFMEGEK